MKLFSFLSRRDRVEVLAIFLGGLVVVVFAFFMARGDLDAYVEILLKGGLPAEEVPLSSEVTEEGFLGEKEDFAALFTPSPSPMVSLEEEKPVVSEQPVVAVSPMPSPSLPRESPARKFFVQVGAFSRESNAQSMVGTLKNLGYSATVERVSSLYRVRIYGFSSMEEAQRVVNRLKAQGIECFAGK
ncbi:MAG: SPOR domain-containing protein [Candidatus Caldatribacteriaceae bacterium]